MQIKNGSKSRKNIGNHPTRIIGKWIGVGKWLNAPC